MIVCGELLARSEFDDHLLTVASEEGRNASNDERHEVGKSLHRECDLAGSLAEIRV
jgi:hypothetical protein